ncbi:MAG: RNA-binding S4 domain-containing protein [Corallococcus sp.]|nr:RNA-binding S4 domain-containing protein [Corallococcus sp.]
MRLDKFLKVSRILKRRTVAQEACDGGKVDVNGKSAKPSCQLKVGDLVCVHFAGGNLCFKVKMLKETVKKDEAAEMYEIVLQQ